MDYLMLVSFKLNKILPVFMGCSGMASAFLGIGFILQSLDKEDTKIMSKLLNIAISCLAVFTILYVIVP